MSAEMKQRVRRDLGDGVTLDITVVGDPGPEFWALVDEMARAAYDRLIGAMQEPDGA